MEVADGVDLLSKVAYSISSINHREDPLLELIGLIKRFLACLSDARQTEILLVKCPQVVVFSEVNIIELNILEVIVRAFF